MADTPPDSLPVSPAPGGSGAHRIAQVTLDEATILWRNADVEQERRVAIYDLIEENTFKPLRSVERGAKGPFHLHLSVTDGRLAMDISELLIKLEMPEAAPKELTVAYHAACSLQHGQKIKDHPKTLLKRAGFRVVEPADSHLCCGSAGTYNLMQPEISAQLKARKVKTLEAKNPDVIAAGNIGCMMQIGSAARMPIVHTVELLDWATGGPLPPAMHADARSEPAIPKLR